MGEEKKNDFVKELISWLLYLGGGFIVSMVLILFVFRFTVVNGDSMNKTLENRDVLYVDKLGYYIGSPKRGDIVVCSYPNSNEKFIKRIIGMPGETIEIKNGVTYINGVSGIDIWSGNHSFYNFSAVKIPDGCYFVMGDNRSNSKDSREKSVGVIKREDLLGRAVFRLFPIDSFGIIEFKN